MLWVQLPERSEDPGFFSHYPFSSELVSITQGSSILMCLGTWSDHQIRLQAHCKARARWRWLSLGEGGGMHPGESTFIRRP